MPIHLISSSDPVVEEIGELAPRKESSQLHGWNHVFVYG